MSKQPVASIADLNLAPVSEQQTTVPAGTTMLPPKRPAKVALTLRIDADLHAELRSRAFFAGTTIQDITIDAWRAAGITGKGG
jgi:hypothetical protein